MSDTPATAAELPSKTPEPADTKSKEVQQVVIVKCKWLEDMAIAINMVLRRGYVLHGGIKKGHQQDYYQLLVKTYPVDAVPL